MSMPLNADGKPWSLTIQTMRDGGYIVVTTPREHDCLDMRFAASTLTEALAYIEQTIATGK